MTYFCAKCQKRHNVSNISADMWEICFDEVKNGVDRVLSDLQTQVQDSVNDEAGTAVFDFFNRLSSFMNEVKEIPVKTGIFSGMARINTFFALNAGNVKQMEDVEEQEGTVRGTYIIRLRTLIALFESYASERDQQSLDKIREYLTEEWKSKPVCQRTVIAFFDENGVLDKVTDERNVPFEVDGRRFGFLRICPYCGRSLSRVAGSAEEIVVALAGSPRAGKSSSMVAMVHSLMQGNCPGVQLEDPSDDESWKYMEEQMESYAKCWKIRKDPDNQKQVPSYSMLIKLRDKKETKRVLTMVDMPGEFWESGKGLASAFFEQYSGIYENIDCIWFVVSKAMIKLSQSSNIPDHIREELTKQTSEDLEVIKNARPSDLRSNFEMLGKQLYSSAKKPIPPTMIIVSKPDFIIGKTDEAQTMMYDLFPERGEDMEDSDEQVSVASRNAEEIARLMKTDRGRLYGLNEEPLCRHAYNVRSFIESANPMVLSAIEDYCKDHFYVTLSPYGRPATDKGAGCGENPEPYHELLPILWTLAVNGVLWVNHKCRWVKKGLTGRIVGTETSVEPVIYHYARRNAPAMPGGNKKERNRAENTVKIYADVTNNMLMNGTRYTDTILDYRKR